MVKTVDAVFDRVVGDDGIDPVEDIQFLITIQYGDSGVEILHAVAPDFAVAGITFENSYADRAAPGDPRIIIVG